MPVYEAEQPPATANNDATGVARTTAAVADLIPSPENDLLYRPIDPADPEFVGLAASVAEFGVLSDLVVTLDLYIVSGHRRHAAARAAGLVTVPVTVLPFRRSDDIDAFVRLLREHNRSRVKTDDERVREELLDVDRDEVYAELKAYRQRKSAMSAFSGTAPVLAVGDQIARKAISGAKAEMVAAIVAVLNDRRAYWPLSDRSVHYALLNNPPLRHASKPASRYANNLASYKDNCDLMTRLRLAERVPWDALAERFRRSGRDRLVLLILSDHDPEGESIAESFARSLRDDFKVDGDRMTAIKVALGPEQVRRFKLPPAMKAKTTSSRYAGFQGRHGDDVWELEALPPAVLADELRRAIEGVLDMAAFERERQREADDACYLEGLRRTVLRSMGTTAAAAAGRAGVGR